jgi:hypothetical protein
MKYEFHGRENWLRGLDLNQRPSGYEREGYPVLGVSQCLYSLLLLRFLLCFSIVFTICNLTKHNETFSSKTNKTTNKFRVQIYVILRKCP